MQGADTSADFERVIVVDNREPLGGLEIEPVVVAIAHEGAANDFRVEADAVPAGREQDVVARVAGKRDPAAREERVTFFVANKLGNVVLDVLNLVVVDFVINFGADFFDDAAADVEF